MSLTGFAFLVVFRDDVSLIKLYEFERLNALIKGIARNEVCVVFSVLFTEDKQVSK